MWNTRHDGTRNPRAGSVALWRELERENPRLVPLFAVDFHSTSDFSSAAIGVDAPRDRDAILDTIASGRHVLLRERTPLPVEPATAAGRLASRISTRTFDAALRVNKALSRLRLKPPAAVRRVLKRAL